MRLSDIEILDLTRLLPGPFGSQLLADLGAEVVKVEDPDVGDYGREFEPAVGDYGPSFSAVNRGKKSVAIDLKTDAGREAFYALVEDADVVYEGFRPGVADRLGIGYEDVREHNPRIVYCSLSGYGQTGPYRDRAGHDLNYVGIAGLLDMTRPDDDAAPVIPGYPIGDMAGGLFAAFAIVAGLLSRELTGDGEYIDVAMTDVVAAFSHVVSSLAFAGRDPRPGETPLTGAYPWYDVYEAADGRYVTLAAIEPAFWETFCEAVGRDDLIEHHGATGTEREALREELADLFRSRTRDEWERRLGDRDAMFGVVNTVREAIEEDPQIRARGLVEGDDPPRIGFPAAVDRPDREDTSLPAHGEHTEAVLREHGITDIEGLRDADAI